MAANKNQGQPTHPSSRSQNAMTGDALKDAKLDALISDQSEGEFATVIREMARVQKDNIHLKKQNVRIWSIVLVLVVGFVIVIGSVFWWFPKYRYIATTDNKAICEIGTQANNIITPASLEDFAKDAVVNAYSYDYVNYRSIIADVTNRYFTERGRKSFLKSLDDSGNLERVVKGRLIMKAFATTGPQLESEGQEGTRRYWIIYVPTAIEFYVGGNSTPSNTQDFLAEVKVMQDQASALNPKGINVDSIVLKPSIRRK
jgi:intracellular multiplication protein IcmL